MSMDWRLEPITRKQVAALKTADDWFTFDRLEGMTKGEASDYIEEYYKDGRIIEENINMRYKKEKVEGVNGSRNEINSIVRDIVNEAARIVMERYKV